MKSLYKECLSFNVAADSEQALYVFAESVLYLLGANGAFEYQRHIKPYCKTRSAKNFRLRLREHRYSNLDIKLYLIKLVLTCTTSRQAKVCARSFSISTRDAKLIWMLLDTNPWFRRTAIKYIKALDCTVFDLTYTSIHATFNRVFPSVFKYVKHITYSKLRFLVKSTNSDFADFHGELSAKLVQSFYAIAPTQMSDAHLINYLKRIVHNHAINLIESGTTQKRGRLISSEVDALGGRQFSLLCTSQNQMAPTELGDQPDVDGSDDSAEKFELQFSISEVLNSFRATSRKYKFLTLLLGAEDEEFSKWLQRRGSCIESEDNVDVQNRTSHAEYTRLISDFLKVPQRHVASLFESLKLQLAWG